MSSAGVQYTTTIVPHAFVPAHSLGGRWQPGIRTRRRRSGETPVLSRVGIVIKECVVRTIQTSILKSKVQVGPVWVLRCGEEIVREVSIAWMYHVTSVLRTVVLSVIWGGLRRTHTGSFASRREVECQGNLLRD